MKKSIFLGLLLLLVLPGIAVSAPIHIFGSLTTDLTMRLDESHYMSSGGELKFNLDHQIGDAAFFLGINGKSNESFKLELDEVYLDYHADKFDLRLGKQRLSWGTALQINPTDVINPVNMEDPLGEKLALYAVAIDYYLGYNTKINLVWVLIFKPAFREVPHPSMPEQLIILDEVEPVLENSELGVRVSLMGINGWDFSASYFRGREDFPTPSIEPGMPPQVNASFQKTQMLGLDLATTIGDAGLWGEGAYFLPEDGQGYYQFVLGGDYGFQNGLVLIGQYYHVSGKNSNNNLIFAAEYPFGLMHSAKLGAIYSLDSNEYLLSPEVTFSLADFAWLIVGAQYFSNSPRYLGMPGYGQNGNMYAKVRIGF